MSDGPKRASRSRARKPAGKNRLVIRVTDETLKQLGIICAMEKTRPRAWFEARVAEASRRYVVQVRGPAGPDEAAA